MTIILQIVISVLIILSILETAMYYLTHYPNVLRLFPRKFRNSITYLYIQGDRKIMHFQNGCGAYSPDLGYTLKPGSFTFTEIEFSNEYRINSLGVRDEEQSLMAPEIVFLGDSFTLGWGVDQGKTFIKLLGEKTNLKTLNTSVPSYGTVREMIMLRKVDRSQLKCLILQYCGDDYDENRLYFINGNRPQILRAETFQRMTRQHSESSKHYFPGKYIQLKIKKKFNEWKAQPVKTADTHPLSEVDLFIHVLKQNEDLLAHLPMIVFEMNGINQTNEFTKALRKIAVEPAQPAFIRNMTILDLSQYLEDKHFFVLDGHLNNAGHAVVADILYEAVLRMSILTH
jgi:hypothetical protein